VFNVKEKALAWDWIPHWMPKVMTMFSPKEIREIWKMTKRLTGNFEDVQRME